jgi:hypothetical protein
METSTTTLSVALPRSGCRKRKPVSKVGLGRLTRKIIKEEFLDDPTEEDSLEEDSLDEEPNEVCEEQSNNSTLINIPKKYIIKEGLLVACNPLSSTLETYLKQPLNKGCCAFPLTSIAVRDLPRLFLPNLVNFLGTSDISRVDYTKGGTNRHILEPLNNLFSDNILISFMLPEEA